MVVESLVQKRCNSSAYALELLLFCTNPNALNSLNWIRFHYISLHSSSSPVQIPEYPKVVYWALQYSGVLPGHVLPPLIYYNSPCPRLSLTYREKHMLLYKGLNLTGLIQLLLDQTSGYSLVLL